MKKLILLFISMLCISCDNTSSVYNYPNGVIVDRAHVRSSYTLSIRYRYSIVIDGSIVYRIKSMKVPLLEYNTFSIGDTIKVEK